MTGATTTLTRAVLTRADGKRMLFHDCENPAALSNVV